MFTVTTSPTDQPARKRHSRAMHAASIVAGHPEDDVSNFLLLGPSDLKVDLYYHALPEPSADEMLCIGDPGELALHERRLGVYGAFKQDFESPEFQAQRKQYPPGTEVSTLCFRGSQWSECVWVVRSHLSRFCRWSVNIYRKRGET